MENKILKIFLFVLIGFVLKSCSSKSFKTKEEMWSYLKDPKNGYHQTKTVSGVQYSLTLRPTDFLVHQELNNDYSTEELKTIRAKYQDYLYFNLSISANGQELLNQKVGNRSEFGAMVNKLSFGMHEKIYLLNQARDTLDLVDYIYPRMFGMSNSTDMLIIYRKNEVIQNEGFMKIAIQDLGFKTGEVSFKIPTSIIINEPNLVL